MRKTFLKVSILGMLTVGMAAGFTSCKDYDDDIKQLQEQVDAIKKSLTEIEALVNKGVIITGVTQNADGITINMSNNQSYNITNGKNGKDADVWTIEKNDKGEYMWAKNGTITEFPAQGPAGTAVAGTYYVPNAETGVFDEYKDGKLVGPTTIPCFAKGSLTAVDDGNYIVISGIIGADGKETEPYKLSKTGALSSLEFIPDLYVDGIETMRAQYATGYYKDANAAGAAITNNNAVIGKGGVVAKAVVAKGEIVSFTNSDDDYVNNAENVAKYILNPANANLTGISYSYKTNVATVENRAAEDLISVVGQPTKDENGDLVVNFTIADYSKIYDQNGNVEENGTAVKNKQTVAALMATLPDNSVVASNFVAVETQNIEFSNIQYHYAAGDNWQNAYPYANNSNQSNSTNDVLLGDFTKTLALPYNSVSNLPDYLRIQYGTDKYFTLAQIAEKYGYTMSYSLLTYTIGANATSEDMYAAVSADGKFQPKYVNAAGESVNVTSEAGRSAIGRQPVVILQLKDAEGNVVLGGFVKVVLTEKTTEAEPINLGNVALGYLCTYTKTAAWDVFAGQVVEATGMTITEFQKNYKLKSAVLGVEVDGKIVEITREQQSTANLALDPTHNWNDFGTFAMTDAEGGSATQQFKLTISQTQAQNWYPEVATKDGSNYKKGDQIGVGDMTTTPVTKKLYAKFFNESNNSILWVGYTVTLTGVPTVTYDGKLASQWVAGKDLVPAHPAIVSDAAYGVVANKITFTTASLWNKGVPALSFAAPYSTDDKSANYVGTTAVDYTFAVAQPSITTNATKTVNGKVVNIVYGFIGVGTKLYGADITGKTGDDITAALNAAKGVAANLFATLDGGIFTITADPVGTVGMVDQVVNTNSFSMSDPKTLFNVEMNLTYGSCNIKVPAFGSFQVGIGRPIDVVAAEKMMEITDGGAEYTKPLYDLAMIQDWQGNALWKKTTNKDGNVTAIAANTLNGTDVFNFWIGTGKLTFGWLKETDQLTSTMTDAQKLAFYEKLSAEMLTSTSPDVTTAVKGARKGFAITFGYSATAKNYAQMNVMSPASTLFPCFLEYQKYGEGATTVTEPFYIFVPVKATYIWGESEIGYATIKINPTAMGN